MVYVLVFVLIVVAAWQGQRGLAGLSRIRRRTRERFDALPAGGPSVAIDLLRRRSRFGGSRLVRAANRLLLQSATRRTPAALAGMAGGIALAAFLLSPVPADAATRLLAALVVGPLVVVLALRRQRSRRMARFGEQLPEILDIIVRSLRAGHPLPVSLGLVAREMPEPAGPEFAIVVDEIAYGRSLPEALENLYDRVGYPELRFVVASTAIAQQTGGNLGEILSRLSRMLRERFRLARRARALSAEGRFSGLALSVLPVALFAIINVVSPAYYGEFWQSPSAPRILAVSVGLLVLGNLAIWRLVNFKV